MEWIMVSPYRTLPPLPTLRTFEAIARQLSFTRAADELGELGVAYQTAWTMAHKLRHGLSEDPARPLRGFLEADETFIGGRGGPASRGRSTVTLTRAWSSLPSRRCRRRRTGKANTDTL